MSCNITTTAFLQTAHDRDSFLPLAEAIFLSGPRLLCPMSDIRLRPGHQHTRQGSWSYTRQRRLLRLITFEVGSVASFPLPIGIQIHLARYVDLCPKLPLYILWTREVRLVLVPCVEANGLRQALRQLPTRAVKAVFPKLHQHLQRSSHHFQISRRHHQPRPRGSAPQKRLLSWGAVQKICKLEVKVGDRQGTRFQRCPSPKKLPEKMDRHRGRYPLLHSQVRH